MATSTHAPELPRKPLTAAQAGSPITIGSVRSCCPAMLVIVFLRAVSARVRDLPPPPLRRPHVDQPDRRLRRPNELPRSPHQRRVQSAIRTTLAILVIALTTEVPARRRPGDAPQSLEVVQGICRALFLLPLACAPEAAALIWRLPIRLRLRVYNALLGMIGWARSTGSARACRRSPASSSSTCGNWTPFVP